MLDSLRFLAAASVVFYHFTARRTSVWGEATIDVFPHLHPFTRYGYLGVDLFFFISGFVILMTAWGRDVPHFVASRVGRLFPAYWTGVLLTGLLLLLTGKLMKDISPITVLSNLTMTQRAGGLGDVDGAYWTLWVELRFYLIIAVFLLVGITRNRVLAFAALWPVCATAFDHSGSHSWFGMLVLPREAPFFAAGMVLYIAYREGLSKFLGFLLGYQLVLAMTYAYSDLDNIAGTTGGTANGLIASLVVGVMFGLVALATLTPLRRIGWGWLTALGALTYPLYVLHEYWGWFVIVKLHDRLSVPLTLVCAIAVVVAMATAVHQLVEKPLGPRLRRWTTEGLAQIDLHPSSRS